MTRPSIAAWSAVFWERGLCSRWRPPRTVLAALVRMKQGLPDVVVTDLQMPEMDGLALIKMIRAHYPRVPVILMTAHGSEELAVEALEEARRATCPSRSSPNACSTPSNK